MSHPSKPSLLPVVLWWTWGLLLLIVALIMYVGVFTFPIGLILTYYGCKVIGKSWLKYWNAIYDQQNHRDARNELDGTIDVNEEDLPWLI